jgi:hypothetical protein
VHDILYSYVYIFIYIYIYIYSYNFSCKQDIESTKKDLRIATVV